MPFYRWWWQRGKTFVLMHPIPISKPPKRQCGDRKGQTPCIQHCTHCADCHSTQNIDSLLSLGIEPPLSGGYKFDLPSEQFIPVISLRIPQPALSKLTDAELAYTVLWCGFWRLVFWFHALSQYQWNGYAGHSLLPAHKNRWAIKCPPMKSMCWENHPVRFAKPHRAKRTNTQNHHTRYFGCLWWLYGELPGQLRRPHQTRPDDGCLYRGTPGRWQQFDEKG